MERQSCRRELKELFVVLCFVWNYQPVFGQKTPCASQVLGVENPFDFKDNIETNTGKAHLLSGTNLQAPCCGVVERFMFFARAKDEVRLQTWRYVAGNQFELVAETIVPAAAYSSSSFRFQILYDGQLCELVAGTIIPASEIGVNVSMSVGDDKFTIDNGMYIGWYSPGLDVVSYNDITLDPVSDGVMSQVTAPVVGTQTAWSAPPDSSRRYAFGAQLGPSTKPEITNIPVTPITVEVSKGVGEDIFTLEASDDDRDDEALGFTFGLDGSSDKFEIDPTTGTVKVKDKLELGTYDLPVIVEDFCETKSDTYLLPIEVITNNPNITSLPASFELREDTDESTVVHVLKYTDDGELKDVTCDYTVSPSPAPFLSEHSAADAHTLIFTPGVSPKLDAENTPSYQFNWTCNDKTADSVTRILTVTIKKNEDPDFDPDPEIKISAQDTKKGKVIGNVAGTDPENDRLNYTLECTDCPFQINPTTGDIYATENLKKHRDSPYVVNLYADDGWNIVGPLSTTIIIEDLNTPPRVTSPSEVAPAIETISFIENTDETAGTRYDVYQAKAEDDEQEQKDLTFGFVWDDGIGEDFFVCDEKTGEIKTAIDLNYEEVLRTIGTDRFYVTITANDGIEPSEPMRLEVIITDENEKPEFKQEVYDLEVLENVPGITLDCPFFTVSDPDLVDIEKYVIDCGANGVYHVGGSSGACSALIKTSAEDDLDDPCQAFKTVTCALEVEDKGELTDTATLRIKVKPRNEHAPKLDKDPYIYYADNETFPYTYIGRVRRTDEDCHDEHRDVEYDIPDTNDFYIDDDGRIYNAINLYGNQVPDQFDFKVTATDDAGISISDVTVFIQAAITTTTSTTTTTQYPPVYNAITGFFSEAGQLAWFIPAMLLSALFLGLLVYTCVRCCTNPGACAALRKGNCFKSSRRVGANARHARAPAKARPPPQKPHQPPAKEAPAKRRGLFDCFDRKGGKSRTPAKDPAKPDEGRMWEAWKPDFPTNWVG